MISGSVTLRRKPKKGEKGDPGENGIVVYASPAALVFQEGETSKSFTVYVTDGGKTVNLGEYGISYIDDYGLADHDITDNVFTVIISNGDNESGYVTLEVSYNDNDYELTVPWSVAVKGEKGNDGTSVTIKGSLDSETSLPTTGNTVGDGYLIDGYLWVWTVEGKWVNVGQIKGDKGDDAIVPYADPSCVYWTCASNGKVNSAGASADITIKYRKGLTVYTTGATVTAATRVNGFVRGGTAPSYTGNKATFYSDSLAYYQTQNLSGNTIYIPPSSAVGRITATIEGKSYSVDVPFYINSTVYDYNKVQDERQWAQTYAAYLQDSSGNIVTMQTVMSQKADSVSLTALKDNLQKAGIIVGLDEGGEGYINITASGQLTIDTDNIKLNGDVLEVANGVFSGEVHAETGSFGGTYNSDGKLQNGFLVSGQGIYSDSVPYNGRYYDLNFNPQMLQMYLTKTMSSWQAERTGDYSGVALYAKPTNEHLQKIYYEDSDGGSNVRGMDIDITNLHKSPVGTVGIRSKVKAEKGQYNKNNLNDYCQCALYGDAQGAGANYGVRGYAAGGTLNCAFYANVGKASDYALYGNGNGVVHGMMEGVNFTKMSLAAAEVYDIDISSANRIIVTANVSGAGVCPPALSAMQTIFGSGSWAVRLTIMADIGTSNFNVYGRTTTISDLNTDQYPMLIDNNAGYQERKDMGAGDELELLLVYDPDQTTTYKINNTTYTAKYTARYLTNHA